MAAADPQDTPMGEADGVATDATDRVAALALSEDEQRVLALYDRLRAQQLEIALLSAQQVYSGSESDVSSAQQQLLAARAAYVLRNEAVDGVLSANPVLKAVHRATHASPIERDLRPVVEQRDNVSQSVAHHVAEEHAVRHERATVSIENRKLEMQNAALAAQVRDLVAEEAAHRKATTATSASAAETAKLAQLEADLKASRQRWKLIKGAASAIVVGSGVDWARDTALRDIVLDPE